MNDTARKSKVFTLTLLGLLLLVVVNLCVPLVHAEPSLFFKSSFEQPIWYENRESDPGESGFLHSIDQNYAQLMTWDDLNHRFRYTYVNAITTGHVDTKLTSERAHSGQRSLYQAQMKEDGAQNRLQFHSSDSQFGNHVFTCRWYYFKNPYDIFDMDEEDTCIAGLRQFDDRISVFPSLAYGRGWFSFKQLDPKLHWRLVCLDYTAGPSFFNDRLQWLVENFDVPIPSNSWFKFDFYVYRHENNGIVKVWVNDELIFNVNSNNPPEYINWNGPGVKTRNSGNSWFMKISDIDYRQQNGEKFEMWTDDFELWRGGIPPNGPNGTNNNGIPPNGSNGNDESTQIYMVVAVASATIVSFSYFKSRRNKK